MDWDYKTNGHYFFDDFERGDSTCDIEFQKGRVTDESHRKDSMYLWDDHFYFLDLDLCFPKSYRNSICLHADAKLIRNNGKRLKRPLQTIASQQERLLQKWTRG